MSDFIKLECFNCGLHLEAPVEMAGESTHCPSCKQRLKIKRPKNWVDEKKLIPCPSCDRQISRYAAACPHCGCPAGAVNQGSSAQIVRKVSASGAGCLLQGVGVLALVIFPIGTIIGAIMILAGGLAARGYFCSACGSQLPLRDKSTRCPSCKATLDN